MNLSDKEFTNRIKLLFSNLFARTMKEVVVGCPDLPDNVFIFSNIKANEMEYYEADSEYFIHEVEIKDTELFEDLLERFDVFKTTTFLFHTDKFLSVFNKHVGELSDVKLYRNGTQIMISVMQKNKVPLVQECGELISEDLSRQYKHLFDSYKVDSVYAKDFDIATKNFLNGVYQIIDVPFFDNRACKAVLVSNKSGISMKEYPSRAKLVDYSFRAVVTNDGTTVRMNTQFDCPDVKVTSIQPHMVWFTKPLNNKENNHE